MCIMRTNLMALCLALFLYISILFLGSSAAEPNNIQWQKCLGGSNNDFANSIQQTSDGGYVLAGHTTSDDGNVRGNHGSSDVWVIKINAGRAVQWQKCLGGSLKDQANSIIQTADGDYIFLGYTESNDGDVIGNHGLSDIWIVKLNSSGILTWQRCLGGSSEDIGSGVRQTTDGGYIIAGYTQSNNGDVSGNHGKYDYWLAKLNSTGDLQWQKCLGGSGPDWAKIIEQTSDGGYIAAGYTESNDGNVSGNHANIYDDYWVVKLNSSGTLQWQKCFGGSSDDFANSIKQTSDGGYIVAGTSVSTNGNVTGNHGGYYDDFWIVKLNSMGVMLWMKSLGGTNIDRANSILQTYDGGYIVAGTTSSNDGDVIGNHGGYDFWVAKLNSSGSIEWQRCLGGSEEDIATNIFESSDRGYIISGYSLSNDLNVKGNHGGYDFWTVKIPVCAIGLFRPSTQMWYLDYDNNGTTDYQIKWGLSTDIPVTGDWDGDGKDETGLFRPSTQMWYLDYDNNGATDYQVKWGASTDKPVVGSWT